MHHPKLCDLLEAHRKYFENGTNCEDWPTKYFEDEEIPNKNENELTAAVQKYGSENLARVRIMIRNPYVTKISRDQAMTFTSYVANTGGLLGLCIGASFISLFEVFYHCILRTFCSR